MKITYPECQIEIDVDEFIELMDYMERSKPKVEIRHDFGPLKMPEIQKFEISEDTKKMIDETIRDHLKNVCQKLLEQTDPNRHGEGILPSIVESMKERKHESTEKKEDDPLDGVSFEDPEHQPAPVPYPKEEETAPLGSTKEVKKKKSSGKMKKVDILFDTGWKTFGSLTAAAKAIDARLNHLSHALMTGKTCNGHHVRYSNPELDAALAEIEEGKKKPYQTTPPVR